MQTGPTLTTQSGLTQLATSTCLGTTAYLLPPGGVLPDVCSEERVLCMAVVIHPLTEMVPNVKSPEKEIDRGAENEANCLPQDSPLQKENTDVSITHYR